MVISVALVAFLGSLILLVADVGALSSCDTCTMFDDQVWCSKSFTCYKNSTECHLHCDPAKAGVERDINNTALHPECIDYLGCFYHADQCGLCIFFGGAWDKKFKKCYPTHGECAVAHQQLDPSSDRAATMCLDEDGQCDRCERSQQYVDCSPELVAVIVISSICAFTLLVSIVWCVIRARRLAVQRNLKKR